MNNKILVKILPVFFVGLAFASTNAFGQLLYKEDFGPTIATSGNYPINNPPNLDWTGYVGATAAAPANPPTAAPRWAKPNGVGAVNDGTGLIYAQGDASTSIFAAHTNATLSMIPASITEINWLMGNSVTTVEARILIQQGGNWYATNTSYTTAAMTLDSFRATPSPSTAELKVFTFTTAAASWRSVTLTPGTELSLGAVLSSDLTSANITSIGFLVTNATSSVARFDELQVIPEPSTWALIAIGLTAVVIFRRRRIA